MSSANVQHGDGRRYLSVGETFHGMGNQCHEAFDLFKSVSIFSSDKSVSQEAVRESLSVLSDWHTLLQCEILLDENHDMYFSPVNLTGYKKAEWIQLEVQKVQLITDWVKIAEEKVKTGFTFPLWRVMWLDASTPCSGHEYILVFICCHAIIDAKSGFDIIANQFTSILRNLMQNESQITLPRPTPLAKSTEVVFGDMKCQVSEEHVPWYLKVGVDSLTWLLDTFFPKRKPNIRTCEEEQTDKSFEFVPFVINKNLTKSLLQFSKTFEVSIHSILLVMLSQALETTRQDYAVIRYPVTKVLFPIDLRKFSPALNISPMTCGLFVTTGQQTVNLFQPNGKDEVISHIKEVNSNVKRQNKPTLSSLLMTASAHFLKKISASDIKEKILAYRLGDLLYLSNIGNCDPLLQDGENTTIRIKEHYFSVTVPFGLLCTVTTLQQQMCLCVAYSGRWLSREFVGKLRDNFVYSLEEICKNK